MMKKSKLSRRITLRVIGIMSFFDVIIVGVIVVFVFAFSVANGNMRGQYVADGIVTNIETMLQFARAVTFNNRSDIEAHMDSPEHVFDELERIMKVNKRLSGCFVAFEPDYFKGQGRWFEAYAYFADSTHVDCRQIGSPQHDYFNSAWYQQALSLERSDNGYLTDLYYDDSVNSGMFCSYAIPVFDRQGRKVGVYGVDVSYELLDKAIVEAMRDVKKEFFGDVRRKIVSDDDIYFSIQIIDSKGNRIAGSDSLDISMLKGEQEMVGEKLDLKDLKGTPYYINSMQLGGTSWTLVVLQHRHVVFFWGVVLALVIMFCMGIGAIVIFFFTSRGIYHATKPLKSLSKSAQEVAKGNFDASLPSFKRNDEVAQLRDSFGTMQQSLKQYMEDLKVSTAAKASIESELNVAHNIQMSMIPKTFPAFPDRKDIELYASLTPAKAVGGDLYDFFIRDEKLFFCIGDVSGKGVPASLVMAVSRTLFRNVATHIDEPSDIMKAMNVNLCDGNTDCMFVTMLVGVFDLQTGLLRYCNAGHTPPVLINEKAEFLSLHKIAPLGLMVNIPYVTEEVVIEPQTTVFLYTDGLNEAMDADGNLFGDDRIIDEMSHAIQDGQLSPKAVIDRTIQAVHQFVGDYEQSDDLTMLAFKHTLA